MPGAVTGKESRPKFQAEATVAGAYSLRQRTPEETEVTRCSLRPGQAVRPQVKTLGGSPFI